MGKEFRLYKTRWLMLAIVVLLQISNAMIWITYAPIIGAAKVFYNTDDNGVDWMSLVFMIASLPLGFVATWFINTLGLRVSIVVAALLNGAGAFIRYGGSFVDESARYAVALTGQIIAACAQPFFLDCTTPLAAYWFGVNERALANTIASVSNPVGIAIASVVSAAMVPHATDEALESNMQWMLLTIACPAGLGVLLAVLFFRSHPPTPPSASAEHGTEAFWPGLKKLSRNVPYMLLLFSFGIGIGLVSAVSSLIGQLTAAQQYSSDQASYMSAAMIGAGIVGAGAVGAFVDSTKMFQTTLQVCFVAASGIVALFAFSNKPNHFGVLCAAFAMLGFFAFAALPVGLELSVEATYPVNEGLSSGLLWMSGQVFGVVIIFATNALQGNTTYFNHTTPVPGPVPTPIPHDLVPQSDYTNAGFMFVGLTGAAALVLLFMRTPYRRLAAEKEHHVYDVTGDDGSNEADPLLATASPQQVQYPGGSIATA